MRSRSVETNIARATAFGLVLYVPVETWASMSGGLLDPFYLVDVVAMVLLLWGVVRSLRARPLPSPEILCVAYAWTSANGWRATAGRIDAVRSGETLTHGAKELWAVGGATVVSLVFLCVLLVLVRHRSSAHGRL